MLNFQPSPKSEISNRIHYDKNVEVELSFTPFTRPAVTIETDYFNSSSSSFNLLFPTIAL